MKKFSFLVCPYLGDTGDLFVVKNLTSATHKAEELQIPLNEWVYVTESSTRATLNTALHVCNRIIAEVDMPVGPVHLIRRAISQEIRSRIEYNLTHKISYP